MCVKERGEGLACEKKKKKKIIPLCVQSDAVNHRTVRGAVCMCVDVRACVCVWRAVCRMNNSLSWP